MAQDYSNGAVSEIVSESERHQTCLQIKETSNMIVHLVDAYDARGEILALAATLANRFTVERFDTLKTGDLSCRAVAAASFIIAMKLRDKTQPLISDLAALTGETQVQIGRAEEVILVALDWKVNVTTGVCFEYYLL